MKKLIRVAILVTGVVYLGWRYRQQRLEPAASAWAAGTDRIGP